jgi:hypothetical protein
VSTIDASSEHKRPAQTALSLDMKLEVVTLPLSDVERAKPFYEGFPGREWED